MNTENSPSPSIEYIKGYNATCEADNPYKEHSQQWVQWMNGFYDSYNLGQD